MQKRPIHRHIFQIEITQETLGNQRSSPETFGNPKATCPEPQKRLNIVHVMWILDMLSEDVMPRLFVLTRCMRRSYVLCCSHNMLWCLHNMSYEDDMWSQDVMPPLFVFKRKILQATGHHLNISPRNFTALTSRTQTAYDPNLSK